MFIQAHVTLTLCNDLLHTQRDYGDHVQVIGEHRFRRIHDEQTAPKEDLRDPQVGFEVLWIIDIIFLGSILEPKKLPMHFIAKLDQLWAIDGATERSNVAVQCLFVSLRGEGVIANPGDRIGDLLDQERPPALIICAIKVVNHVNDIGCRTDRRAERPEFICRVLVSYTDSPT